MQELGGCGSRCFPGQSVHSDMRQQHGAEVEFAVVLFHLAHHLHHRARLILQHLLKIAAGAVAQDHALGPAGEQPIDGLDGHRQAHQQRAQPWHGAEHLRGLDAQAVDGHPEVAGVVAAHVVRKPWQLREQLVRAGVGTFEPEAPHAPHAALREHHERAVLAHRHAVGEAEAVEEHGGCLGGQVVLDEAPRALTLHERQDELVAPPAAAAVGEVKVALVIEV